MKKLELTFMVLALTVLTTMMVTGPVLAQVGAGNTVYVELTRPQCDDQGHYIPVIQDGIASVIGFTAARGGVVNVTVNNVDAELFDADYRPFNTPPDYESIGFRVPLELYPDSLLVVTATGIRGDTNTSVFYPDQYTTLSRLQELSQQSNDDAYYSFRLANAYAGQGDYETAYPYYHRSTGLNVSFYLGSFFLGLALYDDNRDDDAIYQFRQCTSLRSAFYLAYYDMGRCYDRLGRYDDAVVEYRRVITKRPQFVEAHWRLGETYSRRGDWDNAASEYRTALRYNNNFAPAHHGLGAVLAHRQDWDGAAVELRTATNLSPWNSQARADLAATLAHKQDWTDASREYKQAVRLNPNSGKAHQGLAQVQYATGKYDQAWNSVHAGQQAGVEPDPKFEQQLRTKAPEPKFRAVVSTPRVQPVDPKRLPAKPQATKPVTRPTTTSGTDYGNQPQTDRGQNNNSTVSPGRKPATGNVTQPQTDRGQNNNSTVSPGRKPATGNVTQPQTDRDQNDKQRKDQRP